MKSALKILKNQMTSFVLTGFISTFIMFGFYIGLVKIMYYQYAYLIAYIISVIALYFMNLRFVFKKKFSLRSALEFPLIYILQYLVGAFFLGILARSGVQITYAPLIIVIIMIPLTFILNRIVYQAYE